MPSAPRFRLHGMMMVRNEADIVEAAVRHNLGWLDRLVVVDHGSFDGTSDILRRLAAEGLALEVVADGSVGFAQGARLTALARRLFLRDGADFVFALDADEFLKLRSRAVLEEALGLLPPATHAVVPWLTYVPDAFAADGAPFSPDRAPRRLAAERRPLNKVIVARHFAAAPDAVVGEGNHFVLDRPGQTAIPPHARLPASIAALAHYPVRSRDQFERKVVLGYLAHAAAHGRDSAMAFHWREAYEDIRAGRALDDARLRAIACNYGLRAADWEPVAAVALTADPLPFAAALRYPPGTPLGTLQRLMRFCETLLPEAPKQDDPCRPRST